MFLSNNLFCQVAKKEEANHKLKVEKLELEEECNKHLETVSLLRGCDRSR